MVRSEQRQVAMAKVRELISQGVKPKAAYYAVGRGLQLKTREVKRWFEAFERNGGRSHASSLLTDEEELMLVAWLSCRAVECNSVLLSGINDLAATIMFGVGLTGQARD